MYYCIIEKIARRPPHYQRQYWWIPALFSIRAATQYLQLLADSLYGYGFGEMTVRKNMMENWLRGFGVTWR